MDQGQSVLKHSPEWRAKHAEYQRRYRAKYPERFREYQRAYRKANPEIARENELRRRERDLEGRRSQIRKSAYRRLYGITPEDYDRIFLEQGGVCKICGSPPTEGKRLHVDHEHGKNENPVRGLLCFRCNSGLGMFRDDPELLVVAAGYINPSRKCICLA